MHGVLRQWVLLSVALTGMLSASGTVQAAPASPRASPEPALASLLAQSAVMMRGVSSYRFALTYEEGKTTLFGRIRMQRANGEVQRPDRFKATIEARLGLVGLDVEVVSVAQRVWVTFVGFDEEIGIDEDVARVLLDPTGILIGAVETIQQPIVVGLEQIDGVSVTRIAGTVEANRLEAAASNSVLTNDQALPVELAIDDVGHIVSLLLDGPLIEADSDDVVRRLDLSAFDEPVDIEPPA